MSENESSAGSQGTYLDNLKQELAGLAISSDRTSGTSKRKNILEKYFVPQKEKEVFRVLPLKGKKPIQQAFFHVVYGNGQGGKKQWMKLYCPARNDAMVPKLDENGEEVRDQSGKLHLVPQYCPCCEKRKTILATQDQSVRGKKKEQLSEKELVIWNKNRDIFKNASKWEAKKFYIVRGVDKGNIKEGIKFWRFKHNFMKQGPLDKLLPVLGDFIDEHQKSYHDPDTGGDLSITMGQAINQSNNKPYMAVSAISVKGPSKLHEDTIVYNNFLSDPIGWRDVFKLKTAPNVEGIPYLELVAEENNPYWDDSDSNNKKWVFPGHPELQEKANDRNRDLSDGKDNYANFEQASDLDDGGVTISNVTKEDVGTFESKAVDVGAGLTNTEPVVESVAQPVAETVATAVGPTTPDTVDENDTVGDDNDYEDLPF